MVYVEITPFGGSLVHITRRGEELLVSVTFSGAAGTVERRRARNLPKLNSQSQVSKGLHGLAFIRGGYSNKNWQKQGTMSKPV